MYIAGNAATRVQFAPLSADLKSPPPCEPANTVVDVVNLSARISPAFAEIRSTPDRVVTAE
jgi:hypothetical protein